MKLTPITMFQKESFNFCLIKFDSNFAPKPVSAEVFRTSPSQFKLNYTLYSELVHNMQVGVWCAMSAVRFSGCIFPKAINKFTAVCYILTAFMNTCPITNVCSFFFPASQCRQLHDLFRYWSSWQKNKYWIVSSRSPDLKTFDRFFFNLLGMSTHTVYAHNPYAEDDLEKKIMSSKKLILIANSLN
jgi:hypothetical protein